MTIERAICAARTLALTGIALLAGTAGAQDCANELSFLPGPNLANMPSTCNSGGFSWRRYDPILDGVSYSMILPGCDPGLGSCAMTAAAGVTFLGNHQNPTQGFPASSWGHIELWTAAGAFVDACGFAGAGIFVDTGTLSVSGSADCADSLSAQYNLYIYTCWQTGCQRVKTVPLDFNIAAGCTPPPMSSCGEGESAAAGACCLGPGGGAPPVGGGAPSAGSMAPVTNAAPARIGVSVRPARSAPAGITLRYFYGGAGSPGLPENPDWMQPLGRFWNHEFTERIVPDPNEQQVWLITRWGSYRRFELLGGDGFYQMTLPGDEYRRLEWLGAAQGWALHGLDGATIYFRSDGLWERTVDRNGKEISGDYGGDALLDSVAFPDGRQVNFVYTASGSLATMTEVGAGDPPAPTRTWIYTWASGSSIPGTTGDLIKVDRPDGSRWLFVYDTAFVRHLVRMRLEGPGGSPSRIEAAWEYDADGNLIHAWKGSENFATGVDRFEWSYPSETQAVVRDAYEMETTYTFEREAASGKPRTISVVGACPTCGQDPTSMFEYDNPANPGHPLLPWKITNGEGVTTEMTYTDFGKVETRTEAMNTILSRTTSWSYDSSYPAFPMLRTSSSVVPGCPVARETAWSYDAANGNLLDRTESGCEVVDGLVTSYFLDTAFDYSQTTAGAPSEIDPPGFGPADVTTLDYDENRGDQILLSRTHAILGTESYGYDGFNRRTSVTDANGVVTTTEYDLLDRVTAVTRVGDGGSTPDERTELFYTQLGDLYCVRYPEGNGVLYEYETDTGRLFRTTRGQAIVGSPSPPATCLDNSQPRERLVQTFEPHGRVLTAQRERCAGAGCTWMVDATEGRTYTSRCHLDKMTLAPAAAEEAVTEYEYDCNGRLAEVWDANHEKPLAPSTTYRYDALDRLTATVQGWQPSGAACDTTTDEPLDPDCSIVRYDYDIQDHLASVLDGEGNETTFSYSDRDLMTAQASNVSGTTTYEYNEHGELVEEIDARGVVVTRAVDGADRPTSVDYGGDPALLTTYSYGSTPAAFDYGKVVGITRDGVTIPYGYDRFGRVTTDGALAYTYDKNGNRLTISYPASLVATYGYDKMDRPIWLRLQEGADPSFYLVKNSPAATYKAFGPLASLRFDLGTDRDETRGYDLRYSPTSIAVDGSLLSWNYSTDAVGNVTAIDDTLATNQDRSFVYQDWQYFLASASGPWGTWWASYDRIGNRTEEDRPQELHRQFHYEQNAGQLRNTPRLESSCLEVGPRCDTERAYTLDPAGNLTLFQADANTIDLTIDGDSRVARIARAGSLGANLEYDGRGFLSFSQLGKAEAPEATLDTWLRPLYDSSGVLMSLERKPEEAAPTERINVLYFAGRPIGLWKKVGTEAATTTALTTDHLGTPILALDSTGNTHWYGGFEPFGHDWQVGTANDSLAKGIFLRLPGQWDDAIWDDPTLGMNTYYNVHRWYEAGTARYTKTDPLVLRPDPESNVYLYANANPLRFLDPLGLAAQVCCRLLDNFFAGTIARQRHCYLIGNSGTKYGLYPEDRSGQSIGVPRRNDPRDKGGRCENCEPDCEDKDSCLSQATDSYPIGGYSLLGPNSNTFAGTLARKCCKNGVPDGLGSAPGINDDPPASSGGW